MTSSATAFSIITSASTSPAATVSPSQLSAARESEGVADVEFGRTRGDYFSLLCVVSGMEVLKFEGREIVLPQDHFVLWDSDRRMEFAVARPLVKLTLVVPERQIRALLPNAQDYVGVAVDGSRGMAAARTAIHHADRFRMGIQ